MFEIAVVNELLVFQPLKFFCKSHFQSMFFCFQAMRLPEYSTATSVFVVIAMESTGKLLKVFVLSHATTMKILNVAVHGLIAFSKKIDVSENNLIWLWAHSCFYRHFS